MNYPKSSEVSTKVKEVEKKAERFLNKGVVGKSPFNLQRTLEAHEKIKLLLEELEYFLQKDIPEEEVLKKISNIEKEIDLIQAETER